MNESERTEVIKIVEEAVIAKTHEIADAQDNRLVFQELCATARHYGGLRFAMFTVSTTILGALLALELRPYGSPTPAALPQSFILYFRIVSLVFAFLFLLLQWRVAGLIVFYQEKAEQCGDHLKLPNESHHPIWKFVARYMMILPFFLAAIFWIWQIMKMICGWSR